jgi:2-polyprenyl-3-methyl-5-hydroxy-6-metoxy-1,4-benzoquinol methylase
VYNFQRDPDEYDVAFERCGYQLAHARRFEMESAPGFWDLRVYSVAVNVPSLYGEDYYKKRSQRDQILREDQLAALEYLFNDFSPALVVSVGCGEGLLEQEIERRGASVAGIDPGGGRYLGKNKIAELFSQERHGELLAEADALVFCEAIEHVPLKSLQEVLPKFKGRLVVTNIKDYHPIRPNNIDHITRIDDWVYDWISEFGEVRIRDGSHLVVEMKGEQQ